MTNATAKGHYDRSIKRSFKLRVRLKVFRLDQGRSTFRTTSRQGQMKHRYQHKLIACLKIEERTSIVRGVGDDG